MDLVMVDPQGLEVAADWRSLRSPETYLGYGQSNGFSSEESASTTALTSTREPPTPHQLPGISPATGRSRGTPRC